MIVTAARPIAVGVVVGGAAGCVALGGLVISLLYEVRATDPRAFGGARAIRGE